MKTPKTVASFLLVLSLLLVGACSPTPVSLKFDKEKYVLDGLDAQGKVGVSVLDEDGNPIKEGVDVVYFTKDINIIKLSTDNSGTVKALASGEAKIDVEVVGTDIKASTVVRVKIPGAIEVSHEKLRLWTGQVKENVWSEVHSEKGAFIEGYLPEWQSENPDIVKVEQIKDPNRRQSWVKLTGMSSGNTYISTSYKHLSKSIKVRVYDEDEEVTLDGRRVGKLEKEAEKKNGKKKKKWTKKK